MSFFSALNNKAKAKTPSPQEFLPKDAISLSDGKPSDAFLESALDLLSAQQPVWIPSPEELVEIHQQQAMLSMMAAIRQGEKQETPATQPAAQEDSLLKALSDLNKAVQAPTPVTVEIEKEFVNIDSQGIVPGDQRVTLGVASRAVFAKSASAAKKFNIPVACFVASIKENKLGMVFHSSANGSRSLTIELGNVPDCRLSKTHIMLLTQQYGMVEQQARVLAGTIALQARAYTDSITAGSVQEVTDLYHIDYEGMIRLAISIEKWRVMRLQPHTLF